MVRFILLLFVAFLIADWLAPSLSFIFFTVLNLDQINVLAALPDIADRSPEEVLQLAFWTLVVWLSFSFGYIPFGFIRPRAARFSDTKALRYFQSVFLEVILLIPAIILFTWVTGVVINLNTALRQDAVQLRIDVITDISRRHAFFINSEARVFDDDDKKEIGYIDKTFPRWERRIGTFQVDVPEECNEFIAAFTAATNRNEQLEAIRNNPFLGFTLNLDENDKVIENGISRKKCYYYGAINQHYAEANAEIEAAVANEVAQFSDIFVDAGVVGTGFIYDRPLPSLGIMVVGYWFLRAALHFFLKSQMFLSFIRFLDQSRAGYGGAGRFTGLFEEQARSYQGGNELFLGRSLFNPFIKIGMADDRHMLTIGGSRGGKGVSAIIPNLLKWKGSAIVIDPKGTNAAVTARYRREKLGQTVHVIDPFGESKIDDVSFFDPLSQFSPKDTDAREKCMLVADALIVRSENAKDPHWDDKSVQILAGFIAHLMTDAAYDKRRHLPELRRMLHLSGDKRANLLADMTINEAMGGIAQEVANSIINMGDNAELRSILSSIEKHTEWMSSPAMIKAMSQSSFQFSKIKDAKTTIYLVIPPLYLKTHARFIRLFINLTIRGFVDGGKAKVPTFMIMDEFLSLGYMEELENAMSWTAGYNLFLWPFVQDFGSLKDLYGNAVDAFLANCRAVQVFAVNGPSTNEFISERLGKRPLQSLLDVTRSNETLPLREPSEVPIDISAESGRQYILQSGKPTMLLERVPYFKSFFFSGYDPDPDHPEPMPPWRKQW